MSHSSVTTPLPSCFSLTRRKRTTVRPSGDAPKRVECPRIESRRGTRSFSSTAMTWRSSRSVYSPKGTQPLPQVWRIGWSLLHVGQIGRSRYSGAVRVMVMPASDLFRSAPESDCNFGSNDPYQ